MKQPLDTTRLEGLLKELVRWTRATSIQSVEKTLRQSLSSPKEKRGYHLTDGQHTQGQIAEEVGVTQPAVSYWWKKWKRLGLTEDSDQYPGRQVRCFDLRDFDMPIPTKKQARSSE